eukprot:5036389-Pyramimonas_sp.AAC.1
MFDTCATSGPCGTPGICRTFEACDTRGTSETYLHLTCLGPRRAERAIRSKCGPAALIGYLGPVGPAGPVGLVGSVGPGRTMGPVGP